MKTELYRLKAGARNPARTLAPNLYGGGQALSQLWLYIVAPLAGGLAFGFLFKSKILAMGE
jgi:aquaporin Z